MEASPIGPVGRLPIVGVTPNVLTEDERRNSEKVYSISQRQKNKNLCDIFTSEHAGVVSLHPCAIAGGYTSKVQRLHLQESC